MKYIHQFVGLRTNLQGGIMDTTLSFQADDSKVSDVLFSNYKFEIPRYQRPYAWGEDQISDFWNDIIVSPVPFFIGSFILNYEFYKETGFVEVIDGQQRMLSMTIFIAALRDLVKEFDMDVAKRFQRQDISFEGRDGTQTLRIICGDSTQDYYSNNIQQFDNNILESKPKTKELQLVKKNYEYLYNKVRDELEKYPNNEDKVKFIEELRTRLANLIVIHIQINSEDDAYEIFETTNARGIDLSVADLVKNLVFKKIRPGDDRDFAKEVWQEIVNNVQSTNTELKKFLRYYWISKHSFVTEKRLFKEIKREIVDWIRFLEDLWDASEIFNLLMVGNEDEWRDRIPKDGHKIHKAVSAVKYMNVTQCYVLFLSILRNHSKLGTNPAKIFQLIEKFSFNYSAVCKLPGNKVEKIYSRFALRIEQIISSETDKMRPRKIQSLFTELRKELSGERPPYDYFVELFQELRYKNSESGRILIKYILNEYNSYLWETEEQKIDFTNVNIEHIIPRSPDEEWNLTKEEIKGYVNLLGNLTLVDQKINSRIGNKSILKKVEELKKSTLPITRHLVDDIKKLDYEWNENEIGQRQLMFAGVAYREIWDY